MLWLSIFVSLQKLLYILAPAPQTSSEQPLQVFWDAVAWTYVLSFVCWVKLLGCVSAQEVIDLTTLNALTDDEKSREIIRLKRKVTHLPVEIISKIRNAFKLERKLDGRKDVNKAFDEVINEVAKGYKQNN